MSTKCQKCDANFEVGEKEKQLLQKLAVVFNQKKYEIPQPANCPDCRLATRTVHRNEQNFYQSKSSLSGKPIISLYSPHTEWGKRYKIYTHEEWWSDQWDPMEFGADFDFNKGFFEQFYDLSLQIPKVNLIQLNNENCEYTTGTGYCKNCYLINCSENSEDCYYGKLLQDCKDVMDSSYAYNSELLYQCFYTTKCYNCVYVFNSQNTSDSWFCDNLRGSKNCFLSTNLVNKEYYFMNKPFSKTEYEEKVKQALSSPENFKKALEIFEQMRKERIYKYANIVNSENSTGDFLTNCKDCEDCYDVNDSENCQYITVGVNIKDVIDCSNMYLKPELCYQVLGTIETYNVIFSLYVFHSSDVMYSEFCFNSSNLFGCSGLRNKKYCIFNKQYTQAEYEQLVPKIIEHMQKTGEWGQFFPAYHTAFGYNETVAQEYLPLNKEQAQAQGYRWKEADKRDYLPQTYQVPTSISAVTDEILANILACKTCKRNYKIIPVELAKLKKLGLAIPSECPDCRHNQRMTLRQPRKLYNRNCAKCSSAFKTPFAPSAPEIIYCEKCYLSSVS